MRAHIRRFRKTPEKHYETHHRSSGRRAISGGLGHGAGRARFNGATEFQGFSPSGGTVGLVTYFGPWGFSSGTLDTVLTLTPVATPLPAALPLFATGLGALGLLGWRRKRKAKQPA